MAASQGSQSSISPMMEQYLRLRRGLPKDVLLFFRLGDFYEMFFEDAQETASLLGLTLTRRHQVPMCGVPHHSAEGYIGRLVKAGKRVALAEQTSVPTAGKLVEREIVQVISAGTISDFNCLEDKKNSYIVAVYKQKKSYGFACVDHTTGGASVAEFSDLGELLDEVERLKPAELLLSEDQVEAFSGVAATLEYEGYAFLPENGRQSLCEHFKVHSLEGFGCESMPAALGAVGAIFHYLSYQLRRDVSHIHSLKVLAPSHYVQIDRASIANLDLVDSRSGASHSLLGAIDKTSTPMGGRKLHHWVLHPLKDKAELLARQQMIGAFLAEDFLMSKLREELKQIRDLERLMGRLSQGSGTPRDLQALAYSLSHLPHIQEDIQAFSLMEKSRLDLLLLQLGDFSSLVEHLLGALAEEVPLAMKEGGIIREGFDKTLDELRSAATEGKTWLAELQQKERERTGIESLKIRFNNVFGYYIEITKSHYHKVPDDYERKQTLVNAERFVTPELKEMESKILGAEERSKLIEYDLFVSLRQEACAFLGEVQTCAQALAELDVLLGLAQLAQQHHYVCPLLTEQKGIFIEEGRHPVIEQSLGENAFVANETYLSDEESRLILLTGPNMAGKSTYIRQVALIVLLAQIGSYVPAKSAKIGLVDKIFCRVGASDDLARGQSTFMVEMSETALILNNATERSLVILDEIGRGTATFDGLSIAWAVAEYLHDEIGALTLFATHYHELTDLERLKRAVANYNVAVREWHEEIIFLRKILPGAADKSYGIQVARLAGLPPVIIERAKKILSHLELNAVRPEERRGGRGRKDLSTWKKEEGLLPQTSSTQMEFLFGGRGDSLEELNEGDSPEEAETTS